MKTKRQDKSTSKPQKSQRKLPDLPVKKDVRGGEVSLNYTKIEKHYSP